MKTAEQKGVAKGFEKGEASKATSIARQMKADGLAAELIAKYTGLSTDEIEKL